VTLDIEKLDRQNKLVVAIQLLMWVWDESGDPLGKIGRIIQELQEMAKLEHSTP